MYPRKNAVSPQALPPPSRNKLPWGGMGLVLFGSTAPARVSGTKQDPQNYLLSRSIREIKESVRSLLYSSRVQWCIFLCSGFPLLNGQRWPFPHSQKQGCLNKTGVHSSDLHDFKSHLLRTYFMQSLVLNVVVGTTFPA